jgi:predicted nuclease of predicted toxin-antitoxin system
MAEKIKFYFDEMMRRAVATRLIEGGIEVVMAVDVDMTGKTDPEHLRFAAEKESMLVTFDRGFAGLTSSRTDHSGLICWTGKDDDIGGMIRRLIEFAETHTAEEVVGRVFWMK